MEAEVVHEVFLPAGLSPIVLRLLETDIYDC